MKKTLLTTAILATTLVSSSAAFAEEVTPAQTTVHWVGSITDVIPGDNIVITGAGRNVNIANGDLNLQTNGTFESSEIVLETHDYDSTNQTIGANTVEATWTLLSVDYVWGSNNVANAKVQVFDKASATPDEALVPEMPILSTSTMSLQVKNEQLAEIGDIEDTSASAKVNVTMTAAFPA